MEIFVVIDVIYIALLSYRSHTVTEENKKRSNHQNNNNRDNIRSLLVMEELSKTGDGGSETC